MESGLCIYGEKWSKRAHEAAHSKSADRPPSPEARTGATGETGPCAGPHPRLPDLRRYGAHGRGLRQEELGWQGESAP